VAITDGVRYSFAESTVKQIGPGERVVVVENSDDFRARYGNTGIKIAGQYKDKLSNGGERILLTFGKNVPIQDFTFNDKWYPLSDGQGHSLEIIDPKAATTSWNGASAWQASQNKGGTPGR